MYNTKRYLVTAALPYANGPLHLGHLAGAYLSADIFVRMQRLMDKDIVFVCGSDEHGAAITMKAIQEKTTPQAIVDKYHTLFQKAFEGIHVSFDVYDRTSAELHHETSQDFFRVLNEKGEFIEKTEEQYYDEVIKNFLADRYIVGTCPKCSNEEAYGDQCENCGTTLSPKELINPKSKLSGSAPTLKETKHWYLDLAKHESWLKEWLDTGKLDGKELHEPKMWKNHVLGQCRSWLDDGLRPRSMTRDLDWGVDVPQELDGAEGKKLYVWLDAPIGYISATKKWAKENNKDWEPYWKDEDSSLIHFIGKDNIVFHCIIFPAILKAHGEYVLPVNVPANQFLNLEGRKLSTSKNWAVWVNDYLEDIPNKEDELRYTLIKDMPEQKDSEFTWKGYQDAVNNELVNNLGNFVNRVISLINKYYDGVIPAFDENQTFVGCTDQDFDGFHETEMLQLFDDISQVAAYIRRFDFRAAIKLVMEISAKGNQLLQYNEPWKQQKESPELVKAVMNLSVQFVTALSVVVRPFLPLTSDKLRSMLNLPAIEEKGELLALLDQLALGELPIPVDHKIGKQIHLFSRIEDEVIESQLAKLKQGQTVDAAIADNKSTIKFDDFTKLDIRTATILSAEKVEKADKLLKLQINMGGEERTVVSGISQHYSPDEVVGKKVTVLANLAPRKIRGIESQGMILMAENNTGELCFVSPEKGIDDGSIVR